MERIYQRLGLTASQIHGLAQPVQGAQAHGEGIHNPAYRALWQQMLELQREALVAAVGLRRTCASVQASVNVIA